MKATTVFFDLFVVGVVVVGVDLLAHYSHNLSVVLPGTIAIVAIAIFGGAWVSRKLGIPSLNKE